MAEDAGQLERKAGEQLEAFLSDCGIERCGGRVLEIGFKNGRFLRRCMEAGFEAVGTEIEPAYHANVSRALQGAELLLVEGCRLGLPDESVDYVVSFQVLEHVGDPREMLEECWRVLRPGGVMYHVAPNYASFYEGHYGVIWLPVLGRRTGRWYLRLLGRYSPYYEGLQLLRPGRVRRMLESLEGSPEIMSLGLAEFERKFTAAQAAKVRQGTLRGLLAFLRRRERLGRLVMGCVGRLGWYYPLTIIVRKRAGAGGVG